jgi:HD-like signal output (HDOD) protein
MPAMTSLISTFEGGKPDFYALLWKRMGDKGDFPSLSKSVHDLAETMHDEDKSISEITGAILSDFTLTQKVIRLANSAMYAGMGGEITTVTKAAVVLGFDAISHLALSVRFVDTLTASSPDSVAARTEMARALIAGDIARNLANKANLADGEEAVVCALMHHLGRLLLVFYFPDEWTEIQKVIARKSVSENQAALEVIGITLDEISQEVAKSWRLPKKISNSMTGPTSPGGSSIPGSPEWLKSIANFAGEAAALTVKKGAHGEGLKELAARYGDALLVSAESITESVKTAVAAANDFTILEAVVELHGKPSDSRERLAAGVLEVTNALAENMSFGNALNLVLETMYGGMGFNRVVAFLRDGDCYKGKIGFGNMMPDALPQLTFPEAYAMDVFHLSLANKADVFIEDVAGSKTASSMPAWFTASLPDVRAFVLFPLTFNGRPIGLLYGDWQIGTTGLVEKDELLLMRSLRDHLMKLLGPKKS